MRTTLTKQDRMRVAFQMVADEVNQSRNLRHEATGLVTKEQVAEIFIRGGDDSHPVIQQIKTLTQRYLQ